MKILAKVRAFAGGAPLSLLEYLKILKRRKNKIFVASEYTNNGIEQKYVEQDFNMFNIKALNNGLLFSKVSSLFEGYNLLIKHNIEAIIVSTGLDIFFYSYIAKLLKIPVLIIVAGGKLSKENYFVYAWGDNPLICYSKENYIDLVENNYKREKIYLISNRINIQRDNNSIKNFERLNKDDSVKLLLISRLDVSKMNSIRYVIKVTEELLLRGMNIKLEIAGDGPSANEVDELIDKANNNVKKNVIEKVGFVKNIDKKINESHIVFGKGRSVIEAVLLNRIGIVVSEDMKMSVCTTKSRVNLTDNNFAGRNILYENTTDDIYRLVKKIKNHSLDYSRLSEIAELVEFDYSSDYLEEKLDYILKKEFNDNQHRKTLKPKLIHKFLLINRVFYYYFLFIKSRIIKIIENSNFIALFK